MKTYRIKKITYNIKNIAYIIQRKSIFGFWYNPDNIDGNITGVFKSFEEAKERIKEKLTKEKSKIVYYNKNDLYEKTLE